MTDTQKPRVLITGAGGMVAPDLAGFLASDYRIRLSDIVPVETQHEFIQADLADQDAVAATMKEVDVVVHLGAVTWDKDTHKLMIPSNIAGTYNVFEEARKAGVRRIVFASTHHTVGHYHETDEPALSEDVPVRPDTFYAVTKIYGEALARLYHERFGMRMYCLRIGYYMTPVRIAEGFGRYKEALILSPRDFAHMVSLCLSADQPRFGIYNCISNARRPWLSTDKATRELGYAPVGTVESLFGDEPPADDLTPEHFSWMHGPLNQGPEREA